MGRTLLVRGMLVGLLGGLLAFGFAAWIGEPQVDDAIEFESQRAAASGAPEEPPMVSRTVQRSIGLAAAVGGYGIALGGLFGLAFAVAWGRVGRLGARATSALLALAGFVVVELVPFLKYPANPPAVGDPETAGRRTALYLAMIIAAVLVASLALWLGRRLAERMGLWNAVLLAIGSFIALVAAVAALLPAVNEVPAAFPAVVLWRFRLASLGTHVVLWTTFGLLFGALTQRQLDHPRAGHQILAASP